MSLRTDDRKMGIVRIFIVEDDHRVRETLTILLGGEPTIEIAGIASSAEEALERIEESEAEIVLSDLGLPGISGVELIRELRRLRPELEIMAYTVFEDRKTIFAALKAGASGYLLKGATPRELVEGLTSLAAGGAPMSPRIARQVVREFRERDTDGAEALTARERQVLAGVDQGFSYKEIAGELGVSHHTVHGHVKKIYDKLHARGRREAVAEARRRGLL